MNKSLRILWLLLALAVLFAMILFVLGSTVFFQKKIDLVTSVVFMLVWIPALIFVCVSFFLLKKRWLPNSIRLQVCLTICMIVIATVLISSLVRYSNINGLFEEHVTKDVLQTTADGKYEYRLEIVNAFQKNSYVRLYVKDTASGEEVTIPLEIPMAHKAGITGGEGYTTSDATQYVWSKLSPLRTEFGYKLITTNVFDDAIYSFQIDMETKTTN